MIRHGVEGHRAATANARRVGRMCRVDVVVQTVDGPLHAIFTQSKIFYCGVVVLVMSFLGGGYQKGSEPLH